MFETQITLVVQLKRAPILNAGWDFGCLLAFIRWRARVWCIQDNSPVRIARPASAKGSRRPATHSGNVSSALIGCCYGNEHSDWLSLLFSGVLCLNVGIDCLDLSE